MTPFENYRTTKTLSYVSGQVPVNENGQIDCDAPFHDQALESLKAISKIARNQNLDNDHILKTTVYLTDMTQLPAVNDAYNEFFKNRKPARSALQVGALAGGVNVEIDAVLSLD